MTKGSEFDVITAIDDEADDFVMIIQDKTGTPLNKIISVANKLKKTVRPIIVPLSDETTVLPAASTSVPLFSFRMPYGMILTEVRASVNVAGTGAALVTVDIHESGTTVLSTKITIDATEKTSETAATPPVIDDSALADDALIEVFLDVRDTDNVATGLKVTLIGVQA